MKKKVKTKSKSGEHMMPDGTMMKDSEMKKKHKKQGKCK